MEGSARLAIRKGVRLDLKPQYLGKKEYGKRKASAGQSLDLTIRALADLAVGFAASPFLDAALGSKA